MSSADAGDFVARFADVLVGPERRATRRGAGERRSPRRADDAGQHDARGRPGGRSQEIFGLITDLTGEVRRWGQTDDGVLIELTLSGRLGGRPITLEAIDRLVIGEDGLATERISYFDPTPLVLTAARRPRPGRGSCAAECAGFAARAGSVEQADLAQDRDRVRVDVLALDEAVLERDRVDPVPAHRVAARRRLDLAAAHRVACGSRSRSTPGRPDPRGRRAGASRTAGRARSRRSRRCDRAPPRRSPTRRRCGWRTPCRARASRRSRRGRGRSRRRCSGRSSRSARRFRPPTHRANLTLGRGCRTVVADLPRPRSIKEVPVGHRHRSPEHDPRRER